LNERTCIPLAAFKKSRVAKMGQFGRWNLHKREAQGLFLHGSAVFGKQPPAVGHFKKNPGLFLFLFRVVLSTTPCEIEKSPG
jgi:hypothetical protein